MPDGTAPHTSRSASGTLGGSLDELAPRLTPAGAVQGPCSERAADIAASDWMPAGLVRQVPMTASQSRNRAPGQTPRTRIASAFALNTTFMSISAVTGAVSLGDSKYIRRTTRR